MTTPASDTMHESPDDLARHLLAKRVAAMFGLAPAVHDPANIPALHRLRIACKQVRYGLEMQLDGSPGKDSLLDTLGRFQTLLGDIHDIEIRRDLVRAERARIAGQSKPRNQKRERLDTGLQAYEARLNGRLIRTRAEFVRTWDHAFANGLRESLVSVTFHGGTARQ